MLIEKANHVNPVSPAARVLIWIFRVYKKFISPLLPPACRFTPTCSEYAAAAVNRYGAAKGLYLALKRLLRCNPFCRGGFDPVR